MFTEITIKHWLQNFVIKLPKYSVYQIVKLNFVLDKCWNTLRGMKFKHLVPLFRETAIVLSGISMRDVYRDEIFLLTRPRLFKGKRQTSPNKFRLPREKEKSYGEGIYGRCARNATLDDSSFRMDFACRGKLRGLSSSVRSVYSNRCTGRSSSNSKQIFSPRFSHRLICICSPFSIPRSCFISSAGDKIPAYNAIVSIRFLRSLSLKANIRKLANDIRESQKATLSALKNRLHQRGSWIDEIVKPAEINRQFFPIIAKRKVPIFLRYIKS